MDGSLIFDVGMNNGDDTAYYLHLGYRVVAIDANPTLIESAKVRFAKEIADGRLTLVNIGIAADHSIMQFWVTEGNDVLSSFDRGLASRYGFSAQPIDIECCPFRDLIQQYGVPFYLKIDIEGNDHLCLADLQAEDAPSYLSLEINHGLDEFITLDRLGFNRFKLVLQNPHQAITLPPKPPGKIHRWFHAKIDRNTNRWRRRLLRLGLLKPTSPGNVPHTDKLPARMASEPGWNFAYGSSGPFGEVAAGNWLTLNDAILTLVDHRRKCHEDLWCDIHARHQRLSEPSVKLPRGAAPMIQRAA